MDSQKKYTPQFSFELFPPRTQSAKEKCVRVAETLSKLEPKYFSVTFGAGGSSQQSTVDTIALLASHTDIPRAPHISCIGQSKETISQLLDTYIEMGVTQLVALRGDLPTGMLTPGEFTYASELISFIREQTGDHFHIEVAAYPEFHPQSPSALKDLENFKHKIDCGANSAITQYFYNPDAYYRFIDACEKMGVTIPIVPGIMPIQNHKQLALFSDGCGAEIPRWVRKRLDTLDDDIDALIDFGKEVVIDLCENLLANGAPGLHFYTLNNIEPSQTIWQALKL